MKSYQTCERETLHGDVQAEFLPYIFLWQNSFWYGWENKEQNYKREIIWNRDKRGCKEFSSTKALYDALYPMMENFLKSNQDKQFESFFGLMPELFNLLGCEDDKTAYLAMIHLPDYLVDFYPKNKGQSTMFRRWSQKGRHPCIDRFHTAERGPIINIFFWISCSKIVRN